MFIPTQKYDFQCLMIFLERNRRAPHPALFPLALLPLLHHFCPSALQTINYKILWSVIIINTGNDCRRLYMTRFVNNTSGVLSVTRSRHRLTFCNYKSIANWYLNIKSYLLLRPIKICEYASICFRIYDKR